MNPSKKILLFLAGLLAPAACCLSLSAAGRPSAAAGESAAGSLEPALRLDPDTVLLDLFYHGASIRFEGTAPSGCEVAVVCSGGEKTVDLKTKGKVFGFLWMNTGDVAFRSVPSLYLAAASKRIEDLAPPDVLERLGVGYGAIEKKSVTDAVEDERIGAGDLFGELVKLKESEGLFACSGGGVKIDPDAGGALRFSGTIPFPAKVLPGEYTVRLYLFSGGSGRLAASKTVEVKQVGTAAFVSSLAKEHGLLYGITAVVIALVVGLLTGLVFGLGSKGGH